MKKILIIAISVAVLLSLGLSAVAAEDPARTGNDVALGGAVIRDSVSYAAETPGWTIYVRPGIRFNNHDRVIGYFDFLVPLYFTDKSVLFFNPRANFDNNDNVEWNVGVGYRHLLANDKLILGGNIFYDGRKNYSGNYFHQIGVGAEVLTEWVNARVNGYISLSDAKRADEWLDWYETPTGFGYSVAYGLEEPLSGLDYEIGFKIPGLSNYVETWFYGGGYAYFADYSDDIVGWGGRIEVVPADFVKLNFTVRDDNLRDTEYAGEVALELPFSIENLVAGKNPFEGLGDVLKGSRPMNERLYEQVRRDVDIVVNTTGITRETHPDMVGTGTEYTYYDVLPNADDIIYVDINAAEGGDGSFAAPFNSVEEGIDAATSTRYTVFIMPGTYSLGTNGINLNNYGIRGNSLVLWGAGYVPVKPVGLFAPVLSGVHGGLTMTGGAASPTSLEVKGCTFEISDTTPILTGSADGWSCMQITGFAANDLYLDIHHNTFEGNHRALWLCKNYGLDRNGSTGEAPIKIHDNDFYTLRSILASNSYAYDIYDNFFSAPYCDASTELRADAEAIAFGDGCSGAHNKGDFRIWGNTFENHGYGLAAISFWSSGATPGATYHPFEIYNNNFTNNELAVYVAGEGAHTGFLSQFEFRENNFVGNTTNFWVYDDQTPGLNLNARNNWWGESAGPNAGTIVENGTGTVDTSNPSSNSW